MENLDANIVAALIAGIVSLLIYNWRRTAERKLIIEQEIRERKLPIYENFAEFISQLCRSVLKGKKISPSPLDSKVNEINHKYAVWLSYESLTKYIFCRQLITRYSAETVEGSLMKILILEEMIQIFREDIGNGTHLKPGDLISMFDLPIAESLRDNPNVLKEFKCNKKEMQKLFPLHFRLKRYTKKLIQKVF